MNVIKGFEKLSSLSKNTVLTIGNFDGIHLGHQKILRYLANKAEEQGLLSLVLTFTPHPEKILGENRIKMIQTLDQRLEKIKNLGIQTVLVVPSNEKFFSLSGQEFIQKIVVNVLRTKAIVVGKNFRFGKNREGDISLLHSLASRFNFQVHSIPPVTTEGRIVSSSLIRSFLAEGEIEKANDSLGRYYEIEGTVIKGKSRGKILGFPTANIQTRNEIVPAGVFITTFGINSDAFPSLTNVGNCPTFSQEDTNIESYIIDFEKNLYGEKITVNFIKKVRNEVKFDTAEDLSLQIESDLEAAKAYFNLK